MPKAEKDRAKSQALESLTTKVAELESRLNWTIKRLYYWEFFLGQLCESFSPEFFPVKELLETYYKQIQIAEWKLKAHVARDQEIVIINRQTGKRTTCPLDYIVERCEKKAQALEGTSAEEVLTAYLEEGKEVYLGIVVKEKG